MSTSTFNSVVSFIYDCGWGYTLPYPFLFKRKSLTDNTELLGDLHIDGDDADTFLLAFGEKFNVDITPFPIGDYFGNEGDKILPYLLSSFSKKTPSVKKALTIGDLENAIIKGVLE